MMKKLLALTLSSTLILGACSIGTNQDNKEDMTKIANISQKISKQNQITLKITITNSHRQIHKTRSHNKENTN